MIRINCHCKDCGRPIELKLDPVGLAFFSDPDKLLRMVVCNRCGDYRLAKGRCEDVLNLLWHLQRQLDRPAWQERATRATRRFAEIVCRHHRVPTIWEPDFVQLLAERGPWKVLPDYERRIEQLAHSRQAA